VFHSNQTLHNVLIYYRPKWVFVFWFVQHILSVVGLELYRAVGNPCSIHSYTAIPSRYLI